MTRDGERENAEAGVSQKSEKGKDPEWQESSEALVWPLVLLGAEWASSQQSCLQFPKADVCYLQDNQFHFFYIHFSNQILNSVGEKRSFT